MTDLDAAIRAKLDRQRDTMTVDGMFISDITGDWEGALVAVLNIHKRDDRCCCTECQESGLGWDGQMPYPCPTVRAIAKGLGIET